MRNLIDRYLDRILVYANKPEAQSQAIRQELEDHLLQKVEDLAEEGMPGDEAIQKALRQHGPPRAIGYRLRGRFPWTDIRTQGAARGVIAIGPTAEGIFAIGFAARGVFAFGGLALGVFNLGVFSLGFYSAGACAWGMLHWSIFRGFYPSYLAIYMLANSIFVFLEDRQGKADWLIEG